MSGTVSTHLQGSPKMPGTSENQAKRALPPFSPFASEHRLQMAVKIRRSAIFTFAAFAPPTGGRPPPQICGRPGAVGPPAGRIGQNMHKHLCSTLPRGALREKHHAADCREYRARGTLAAVSRHLHHARGPDIWLRGACECHQSERARFLSSPNRRPRRTSPSIRNRAIGTAVWTAKASRSC